MDSQVSPTVLTEAQRLLLKEVANCLVPATNTLPGAGDLGVAGLVDGVLAGDRRLRQPFFNGLARIEALSRQEHRKGFAELPAGTKDLVLRQVEAEEPAFFEALVRHVYSGYYTHDRVLSQLQGYENRPPQPQGHKMKPFDPALLEGVRRRGPLYKQV